MPFGQVRNSIGIITQTDFGYTGQRNEAYTDLMDFRSRWYDGSLGRFVQPDSIVPGAGNPQSLNRYTYVINSPIEFNNPFGHIVACETGDNCNEMKRTEKLSPDAAWSKVFSKYGVKTSGKWSGQERLQVLLAIQKIGNALANSQGTFDGASIFQKVFGPMNFNRRGDTGQICQGGSGIVACYANAQISSRFIIHELGHSFDASLGNFGYSAIQNTSIVTNSGNWVTGLHIVNGVKVWERGLDGYPNVSGNYGVPDLYHGPGNWSDWNQLYNSQNEYTGTAYTEEWADMFMNWADGTFVSDAGVARNNWMTTQISSFLSQ